jgi:catechol 2,3-dioxygenase-like lactoylglutathione lyase family enzyme
MDMRLEVVVIGVSDVDRAKAFYQQLGFREDADFTAADGLRVVQVTPPGTPAGGGCSLIFGDKVTSANAGSAQGLMLVVDDLDAARADLVGRGIDVSEIWHDVGGVFHHGGSDGRVPGPDPQGRSYSSFASFSDPDGNGWFIQEIKTRLPGR